MDPTKSTNFHSSVSKYLRNVQLADLQPDYSGMRPKLNPDGDTNFRDFIIQEESDHGFPGFINLIGIESPGLTSSLAIANYVSQLLGYSPKGNFKG
ncbi:hydroxyglutarate oxidase [compost metagenome]